MPVPRIRSLHFLPGKAELQQVIGNKFHLELEALVPIFSVVIPVLFGMLGCGICKLIASLLPRLFKQSPAQPSAGARVLVFILLTGCILSPTAWLGNGYHRYDCDGDVLAADELAGKALQEVIPPQARIFWRGISPVTLLHLPLAKIYPAQLNGDYSYRLDGDADELEKYGLWNHQLANSWLHEADYVLIEERYYRRWFKDWVNQDRFIELEPTPEKVICRDNSAIRVFKRLQ